MVEHYYPIAILDAEEKKLEDFAREAVKSSIPEDVLKTFKKFPGYFQQDNEVRFQSKDGDFYRNDCVCVRFPDGKLPCPNSNYFGLPHNPDAVKLDEKIEKMKEQRSELSGKIARVLDSCTTTKQLAEALPEAVPFIPAESSAGLPVPIEAYESLRKELAIISKTGKKTGKEL
jgi:hypothetical protein